MKNIKVVVVGSLNYDLILTQERLPYKGETLYADDIIQGQVAKVLTKLYNVLSLD